MQHPHSFFSRFCSRAAASTAVLFTVLFPALPDFAQTTADAPPAAQTLRLETLDLSKMTTGYGAAQAGKSVDGHQLTLGGTVYPHGVGTHASSEFLVNLHGAATRFTAVVGVDDEKLNMPASVTFAVRVDGKTVFKTPVLHAGDKPQAISVDLTRAQRMTLIVGEGGDGITNDHADWAGAQFILAGGATLKPEAVPMTAAPPRLVILPSDPRPAIHGARIMGATPGRPFLFRVPATGQGPLLFAARRLPSGLTLDPNTGIVTGILQKAGTTAVLFTVRGPKGTAARTVTIVGGSHTLALTPPMGWNSWNVWATRVDAEKVKAAADELTSTGLAAHGFQYVNIDDAWEGERDAQGVIQTNDKFPDMKALGEYVHGKGLKFGIYSSPGPRTCGGYTASYQHEAQDAQSYANWGVDYLKYDWCSYENIAHGDHSLPSLQKPYTVMRDALDGASRDIVYSLCQYGMGDVWTWGGSPAVGGNCWRTTGDIDDNWGSLHSIYERQAGHEAYAGAGHWNDPDMLMVGIVGKGSTHPTRLTPNEQILHVSLWCLLSSPLLIGCDLTRLDPLTLALLSNDEAIDINQDPLAKPAARVAKDGDLEVWARPLFDGTRAVGLVNGGPEAAVVTAQWADIGAAGRQPVRDLWLHRQLGAFAGHYSVEVPAHGCVLLKVGEPRPEK